MRRSEGQGEVPPSAAGRGAPPRALRWAGLALLAAAASLSRSLCPMMALATEPAVGAVGRGEDRALAPPVVAAPRRRYAIATFVDSYKHMYGLYSIARQAQRTGMVAQGIDVVAGMTRQWLEQVEREGKHNETRVLAQWQDEGLLHKTYVFDEDLILSKIAPDSGLWVGVFKKMFLFNLTDYDKVILLDADVLIRQNLRHWFDYDTPCAIQPKDYLEWNAGVMVITPNRTELEDMLTVLPNSSRIDGLKEFKPRPFKYKPQDLSEPDNWNTEYGDQGFLATYYTTSPDPARRMKTMPTENAVLISSLKEPQYHYFWYRRNHLFQTVHLTKAKPWVGAHNQNNPVVCAVLREWEASVDGMARYNMSVRNPYLRKCK